jgi:hypothetical protein
MFNLTHKTKTKLKVNNKNNTLLFITVFSEVAPRTSSGPRDRLKKVGELQFRLILCASRSTYSEFHGFRSQVATLLFLSHY